MSVRSRQARADRRTIGIAGRKQIAAGRERRQVGAAPIAPRPLLPVGRYRADDEPRIPCGERGVSDAERVERSGGARLDDRVGALAERREDLAAARPIEIERDATLARV